MMETVQRGKNGGKKGKKGVKRGSYKRVKKAAVSAVYTGSDHNL